MAPATDQLRAYVEYLRDMGIHDLYRQGEPLAPRDLATLLAEFAPGQTSLAALPSESRNATIRGTTGTPSGRLSEPSPAPRIDILAGLNLAPAPETIQMPRPSFLEIPIPKPTPFDELKPLPPERIAPDRKAPALQAVRDLIGDCTRCPLAYAGRRNIVFGDGDPKARLLFVGEGPGADEDSTGLPFVGKAGQLLNNMIAAMGLRRDQVYIANIVKCRPPANRAPEPAEANTCSPFLLEQIDIVRPQVIVALGSTAATYLLGVKQTLASLRGTWHTCRGARVAVTYHPAYLLRDPSQKGEAWKDLQRVMVELGLKQSSKSV